MLKSRPFQGHRQTANNYCSFTPLCFLLFVASTAISMLMVTLYYSHVSITPIPPIKESSPTVVVLSTINSTFVTEPPVKLISAGKDTTSGVGVAGYQPKKVQGVKPSSNTKELNKQFCSNVMNQYSVKPGLTWGSLEDTKIREEWRQKGCDNVAHTILTNSKEQKTSADSVINDTDDAYATCRRMQSTYGVVPEKSWGSMRNANTQNEWKRLECNTVLKMGKRVSCGQVNGEEFINDWRDRKISLCDGPKNLSSKSPFCFLSIRDNVQCVFPFLALNFDRMKPSLNVGAINEAKQYETSLGNNSNKGALLHKRKESIRHSLPQSRSFANGFINIPSKYCPSQNSKFSYFSTISSHFPSFDLSGQGEIECDVYESDPVIIISHDSVLNLGHMFEDILNVWLIIALNGLQNVTKRVTLLNIDGLRPGNILKGAGHHLLDTLYLDSLGPFYDIYKVLFKRTISAGQIWGPKSANNNVLEERGKRVCFTGTVYTYPMPMKAFLWDKFEVVDPCSLKLQPNPIYRDFVSNYMQAWNNYGNLEIFKKDLFSLQNLKYFKQKENTEGSRVIRILLVSRKLVTSSRTEEISARALSNPDEIIKMLLNRFVNNHHQNLYYELIIGDFADISFNHQVTLANSIDILIGFHGAGMNHFFHMNYTRPSCCGVIEMFPQAQGCSKSNSKVCTYHMRKAHGNHARYLGYQYVDMTARPGSLSMSGSSIHPDDLETVLQTVVSKLIDK